MNAIAAASGLILATVISAGAVQTVRTIQRSFDWQSCLSERQRDSFSPALSYKICADRLK